MFKSSFMTKNFIMFVSLIIIISVFICFELLSVNVCLLLLVEMALFIFD